MSDVQLLQELTADIVAGYVSSHQVSAADLPSVIQTVYTALANTSATGSAVPAVAEKQNPAVSIRKSITDDFLISLEDGMKYKSLKRHLRTKYNMSPEDYRAKWGLPRDYPMVAPAYAASRSALAKSMGLGLGRKASVPAPAAKKPRATKAAAE